MFIGKVGLLGVKEFHELHDHLKINPRPNTKFVLTNEKYPEFLEHM